MKTATILGQEIKIREDDYKKLLRRFDIKNEKDGVIKISCALCDRYFEIGYGPPYWNTTCGKCPFAVIEEYGCLDWMDSISIGNDFSDGISLNVGEILINEDKGRKAIQRIHQSLVEDFK